MRYLIFVSVVLVTGQARVAGQQPNQPGATLQISSQNGPPWPAPFTWRTGLQEAVQIGGQPLSPFLLVGSPQLCPGCLSIFGGFFDLQIQTSQIILDGFSQPGSFSLDASGSWATPVILPPSVPPGSGVGIQALVQDIGSATGLTLSAAWQITVTQGPTIINLPLADNSFFPIVLPAGFTLPFYGTNYSTIFINSNGSVSFVNGDTDFTPTPAELLSGPPKIAGYWADISPQAGGSVRVILDPIPVPTVRVEFLGVPDRPNFAGVVFGFPHTFYIEAIAVSGVGDLKLIYTPWTFTSVLPIICGISPGLGLDAASQKDLSQIVASGGQAGATNESFYEWFGQTTMFGYTPQTNNLFDLNALTLTFLGVALGTSNPRYFLN